MTTVGSYSTWIGFSVFLVVAFIVDIFFQSRRHALLWTGIWVLAAILFDGLLWLILVCTHSLPIANQASLDFLTGYVIEKSLSIDNLFAFYLIFTQLKIPADSQHRVFAYGIVSAVVLRLGLILIGSVLVSDFHWVLYLMGLFLLVMGCKMLFDAGRPVVPLKESRLFNLLKRYCRVTDQFENQHFFIKKNNLLYATPLFIALIFIEFNDLVFALDSIPAIFAITTDPYIVWTSNVFAILGLRALYFEMAEVVERFELLKYGIALIIIYVGIKILIAPWIAISVPWSLGIIAAILLFFVGLSRYYGRGRLSKE